MIRSFFKNFSFLKHKTSLRSLWGISFKKFFGGSMRKLLLALLSTSLLAACDNNKSNPAVYPESPKGFEQNGAAKTSAQLAASDLGNWFIKDPTLDKLEGVSSERAIREFSLLNKREIIVAVIDSGVDTKHEDLQGKIWVNPKESGLDAAGNDKATNKIDDDGNGLVDDVHGWNYLGGADGQNIHNETLEMTREVVAYEARIAGGEVLTPEEAAYFEKVKAAYAAENEGAEAQLKVMEPEEKTATAAKATLKAKLGLEDYSQAALDAITSTDTEVVEAKNALIAIIKKYRDVARFYRVFENVKSTLAFYLNKSFNPRSIAGDDPNDFTQTTYGNNDVQGPDASHGTHVAGIIAAVRGNGIGIDGVAENVKIMALRVVPNGDERDKDVALAVRYAVDNGAHIINMSFGKAFSPSKAQVDEAFLYAASKGVLIFHSAGNDSSNNDLIAGFPNRTVLKAAERNLPAKISTWIEIGASARLKGLDMVASFSDYGKGDVDIFSPGALLNSTVPGNLYAVYSGTSMAAPAAAGAAALLMSNFPTMTALQAKAILLNQARQYPGLLVRLPGSAKLDLPVPFVDLSASGGVIDAYNSVRLAKELSGL
jgi:cell wall-associated protease